MLFVSLHQWPFWPGTGGPDDQAETTLNVPMRAGSGDDEYAQAFERAVEPTLARFEPELVLVSAGFDAHGEDPLADMRITEGGFRELAPPVRFRRTALRCRARGRLQPRHAAGARRRCARRASKKRPPAPRDRRPYKERATAYSLPSTLAGRRSYVN